MQLKRQKVQNAVLGINFGHKLYLLAGEPTKYFDTPSAIFVVK